MSYKPEVFVNGKWSQNGLAFATQEEAANSAHDLWSRWTLCTGHRAVESDQPVNYTYHDGKLEAVEQPKPEEA